MGVPITSLKAVGAVALFFTQSGEIDIVKINAKRGRYFRCKYGIYQLDYNRKINFQGTTMFVYDSKLPYPLSVEACKRIQLHLMETRKSWLVQETVLEKRKEYVKLLGKSTLRFLGDMTKTDLSADVDTANNAIQDEKEIKASGPISESFLSFLALFDRNHSPNVALVFVDNATLKIVPLKIEQYQDRLIGRTIYGDLDLSDRRNRYTYKKTAIYVTTINTKPIDMRDFMLNSVEMPEAEEIATEPIEAENVVEVPEEDADGSVMILTEDDMGTAARVPPSASPRRLVPAPKYEMNPSPYPYTIGDGNGNGKTKHKKKIDMDLPASMRRQDLGAPITLNMESMIGQFANYEPFLLEANYVHHRYTKRAFNSVGMKPKKQTVNVMIILVIILGGSIIWQNVINPEISKAQTKAEIQANKDRQVQQQPPTTTTTNPPPATNNNNNSPPPPPTHTNNNSTNSEPIGKGTSGAPPLLPPPKFIAPLIRY